MQFGILKTDGGPHSAETWAKCTASQIIDIASSAPEALVKEAREFETKLVFLLTDYHERVQQSERDALDKHGSDHLASEIDTSVHHGDALGAVLALARGTSFEGHVSKPEVHDYLARLLHEHFHHSMHIERSWHADNDPDHEASIAFKEAVTNHRLGAYAGNPKGDK